MRARLAWFCFVLSLIAGTEANADAFRRFLDTWQAAPLHTCVFSSDDLVLDTWPDGSLRTLVATYLVDSDQCGTELGVFRALRNGRFRRLAVFSYAPTGIRLLDVTGNGVPEILVSGPHGNRSTPVAILRWDGARLTQIGETSDQARYVDLNHDGVMEIVESVAGEKRRAYVQRLQKGRYVPVIETR